MRFRALFFSLFAFVAVIGRSADVLATRTPWSAYNGIWQAAGVVGGIPDTSGWTVINMTQAPYNCDPTGATSIVSAFNTAVAAQSATANVILYFPHGTYLVDGQLTVNKNNILVKGEFDPTVTTTTAPNRTVFNMTVAASTLYMGISSSWTSAQSLGSYNIGDTVLTVSSTSGYTAGAMVRIWQDNNTTLVNPNDNPIQRTLGGNQLQGQVARVASVNAGAGTITISPGLHFALSSSRNPQIYRNANYRSKIGVQYIYFDNSTRSSGGYSWRFNCAMDFWADSNYVYKTRNTATYHNFVTQGTVQHNTFYDSQIATTGNPNNAGIKVDVGSSLLIQNNIGYKQYPMIQINGQLLTNLTPQGGSSGNVVAYNYNTTPGNTDTAVGESYTSHDSQSTADLHEGNYGAKDENDAYYGSSQQTTIVRNWYTGVDVGGTKTTLQVALMMNRMTRFATIVGNQLGYSGNTFTVDPTYSTSGDPNAKLIYRFGFPNTGNANYSGGTVSPIASDWWQNWDVTGTLTTRTSNTAGTITLTGGGTIASAASGVSVQWSGGLITGATIGTVSGADVPFSGGSGTVLPSTGTAMQIFAGPGGFQELDLDVYGTMLLKGNYNTQTAGIPASEALAGATVANSYYLTGKPTWFGSLAWPAFDPVSPNFDQTAIPAGYRYVNGIDPPIEPSLTSASINSAGDTLTTGFSLSCTNGAGGGNGMALTLNGNTTVATYSSGSGSATYTYSLSPAVPAGYTATLAYTQPGNGIEATTGGADLASFSGQAVTNNSTAAPSAPSGLTATAAAEFLINLAWTDNSGGVATFSVERSLDGATGWAVIASPAAGVVTYPNNGLGAATTYYYRVRALSGGVYSSYSSTANATTPGSKPFAPNVRNPAALSAGF